jgi:hypothetical protein
MSKKQSTTFPRQMFSDTKTSTRKHIIYAYKYNKYITVQCECSHTDAEVIRGKVT